MASSVLLVILKECVIHVKFDITRTLYIINHEKSRLYGLYFFKRERLYVFNSITLPLLIDH